MARRITSRNHRAVKDVRRLRRSTFRDEHGLFLVEGPGLVGEAVRSGARIRSIYFIPDRAQQASLIVGDAAGGREAEMCEIEEDLLDWVSDVKTSQGLLAVFEQPTDGLEEALAKSVDLVVVADRVRDPGNMGSLIRVADAAGAQAFFTTPESVDIYNPKVVRSSAGSLFHLSTGRGVPAGELSSGLREKGFSLLGLEPRGESDYLAEDLTGPTAIFLGNEASGFDEETSDALDRTLRIEMPGLSESLNVAAAAAVVLFEVVRQRGTRKESGGG